MVQPRLGRREAAPTLKQPSVSSQSSCRMQSKPNGTVVFLKKKWRERVNERKREREREKRREIRR